MNAIITFESTLRQERTRGERLALHRSIAPTRFQRSFTLIEMLVAIVIAVCLIGWYLRVHDEADSLTDNLRRSETTKVDRDEHQRRTRKARAMSMSLAPTAAEADAANNGATTMDEPDASSGEASQTADENHPASATDRTGDAPPPAGE
jgi:prepilin-type N-terminal cleavage/methylation domain-containing protein